jgi:hypothetical protein
LSSSGLCFFAEPRREVGDVADHCVLKSLRCANEASDDLTRSDPDSCGKQLTGVFEFKG